MPYFRVEESTFSELATLEDRKLVSKGHAGYISTGDQKVVVSGAFQSPKVKVLSMPTM